MYVELFFWEMEYLPVCHLNMGWTTQIHGKNYSPRCPNWIRGPPNILPNGYWERFIFALSGKNVKLTSYVRMIPTLGMRVAATPLPHKPSWYDSN